MVKYKNTRKQTDKINRCSVDDDNNKYIRIIQHNSTHSASFYNLFNKIILSVVNRFAE